MGFARVLHLRMTNSPALTEKCRIFTDFEAVSWYPYQGHFSGVDLGPGKRVFYMGRNDKVNGMNGSFCRDSPNDVADQSYVIYGPHGPTQIDGAIWCGLCGE